MANDKKPSDRGLHRRAFLIAELIDQYSYGFIDRLINYPRSPGSWHDLLTKSQCAVII